MKRWWQATEGVRFILVTVLLVAAFFVFLAVVDGGV